LIGFLILLSGCADVDGIGLVDLAGEQCEYTTGSFATEDLPLVGPLYCTQTSLKESAFLGFRLIPGVKLELTPEELEHLDACGGGTLFQITCQDDLALLLFSTTCTLEAAAEGVAPACNTLLTSDEALLNILLSNTLSLFPDLFDLNILFAALETCGLSLAGAEILSLTDLDLQCLVDTLSAVLNAL
jgi:hypothetical protein